MPIEKYYCTNCGKAKVHGGVGRVPIWLTCPYRNGKQLEGSGAPYSNAFNEFSVPCEHFELNDVLKKR